MQASRLLLFVAILLLCLGILGPLHADDIHTPNTWDIRLELKDGKFQPPVTKTNELDLNGILSLTASENKTITIPVTTVGFAATELELTLVYTDKVKKEERFKLPITAGVKPTQAATSFTLTYEDLYQKAGDAPASLEFNHIANGKKLLVTRIGVQAVGSEKTEASGQENAGTSIDTGVDEEVNEPGIVVPPRKRLPLYDEANNIARFYVTANGNVIARPTQSIDRNDKVEVHVIGRVSELKNLHVHRKSAIDELGDFDIIGSDQRAPKVTRESGTVSDPIGELTVRLGDFKPGRGEIEMATLDNKRQAVSAISFDFIVSRLYRGAITFGPVYSYVTDRSFGTITTDNGAIVSVTEEHPRVHYVLAFTGFWQRVDEEKPWNILSPRNQIIRLLPKPTIAVDVRDVFRNLFLGGTFELGPSGFYATVGTHFGRVTRIAPEFDGNGATIGQPLSRGLTTIPTQRYWDKDWFYGVTLDVRAAVKFFAALGGAATEATAP